MNQKVNIIDVRSPMEYMSGHVQGSVNIPLPELHAHMDEIKQMEGDIVVCCASGMRSAQAQRLLQHEQINASNGGSWMDVQFAIHKEETI
ncbi:MAG: rhodanese-like domain-containing protein [Chitinophagales bacterium]|nr:rhodanese-like domain-containing protein [Chitinophagales bacterium]